MPAQGEAIQKGVVDLGFAYTAAWSKLVPVAGVLSMSRMSPAEERANGFYDFMRTEHAKAGLFWLGRAGFDSSIPNFEMHLVKRVDRPQELAGRLISHTSPLYLNFFDKLGVVPVKIPYAEAYVAMQTGVAEGIAGPITTQAAYRFFEVAKYMIDHSFYSGTNCFIMNLDLWNSLPKHQQDVIEQAALAVDKEGVIAYQAERQKARQILKDGGVEFIKFTPEDAKWYLDTAYAAGWEQQMKVNPVDAAKAKELLTKR